jgi:hypothetical protein
MILLDKCDNRELRDWCAAEAVAIGWSRAVLLQQFANQRA